MDLFMGLWDFRGAVSTTAGAQEQPISLNGACPLLNGRFLNLNGPFPWAP